MNCQYFEYEFDYWNFIYVKGDSNFVHSLNDKKSIETNGLYEMPSFYSLEIVDTSFDI